MKNKRTVTNSRVYMQHHTVLLCQHTHAALAGLGASSLSQASNTASWAQAGTLAPLQVTEF